VATSNCGGTAPDDEETEPVKLYTPTMAQDTIIKIPVYYEYFHFVTSCDLIQ